jgi:hypothetical protein
MLSSHGTPQEQSKAASINQACAHLYEPVRLLAHVLQHHIILLHLGQDHGGVARGAATRLELRPSAVRMCALSLLTYRPAHWMCILQCDF